jgi:hypothetical protein
VDRPHDFVAERIRVANDEIGHVALPKLYGAPAYARPPAVPVQPAVRPFDPDELPLEAARTEEEQALASQLAGQRYQRAPASEPVAHSENGNHGLRGRSFRLRMIADRIRDAGGDTGA